MSKEKDKFTKEEYEKMYAFANKYIYLVKTLYCPETCSMSAYVEKPKIYS